ncbi:hypothetical protein [Streptomyces sp. NPDC001507]|uniref:hypothetical protein n=1 Tax=Streptomyces sp. NPDC001507 TaxID=3364579 RepID=UPI00368E2998
MAQPILRPAYAVGNEGLCVTFGGAGDEGGDGWRDHERASSAAAELLKSRRAAGCRPYGDG